jgi:hypothetical protein
MRKDDFVEIINEVIALKLEIADEYISTVIDSIGNIGSPEKIIGKKYDDWNEIDRQLLTQVYGTGDDTPLAKLIFNKEFEAVKKLESEV